jgi:O-antigen/teichoic acid export membrane protein
VATPGEVTVTEQGGQTIADRERAKTYVRGSSLLLAGRVGAAAIGLVTQVLIVRHLTKDDFGAFAYGLSLASLIETLSTLGLDRAISRFVPIFDERDDHDEALGTIVGVFATVASATAVAIIVAVLLRGWSSGSFVRGERSDVLLILMLLAPAQAADNLLTALFASIGESRAIFFRRFMLTPVMRLGVVVLLLRAHEGSRFLAIGYVITGFFGVLLYGGLCVRVLRTRRILSRSRLKTMRIPVRSILLFSLPLFSTDLVAMLFGSVDALLVGHFHGAREVAELRSVQPVVRLNQLVLASFGILFAPMAARLFANSNQNGIQQLYWRTATWVAVLSFPAFVLGFAVARPITTAMFGARYDDAAPILAMLSVGYFVNSALGFNGVTLNVFGHVRPVVALNLASVVLNLVLNLSLIPRYGAVGAATSTTATLIFQNAARHVVLVRRCHIPAMASEVAPVYVAIAVVAAATMTLQVLFDLPLAVGLGVAAAGWLVVVSVARHRLDIDDAFPVLARVPLLRSSRPRRS